MRFLLFAFLTFFLGISCHQKDGFQSEVKVALKEIVNEYRSSFLHRPKGGNNDPTVSIIDYNHQIDKQIFNVIWFILILQYFIFPHLKLKFTLKPYNKISFSTRRGIQQYHYSFWHIYWLVQEIETINQARQWHSPFIFKLV